MRGTRPLPTCVGRGFLRIISIIRSRRARSYSVEKRRVADVSVTGRIRLSFWKSLDPAVDGPVYYTPDEAAEAVLRLFKGPGREAPPGWEEDFEEESFDEDDA